MPVADRESSLYQNSRQSSAFMGRPPPLPLQPQLQPYPRQSGLIHPQQQQLRSQQSHSFRAVAPAPGHQLSPHSTTRHIPQQPLYVGSGPGIPQQQQNQGDATFFVANPSPYNTNSVVGSYMLSDSGDHMANQAAINRQSYPPMSSYHSPQPSSPTSISSPQTDTHGRPLYSMPPMAQNLYFPSQFQMQAPQQRQQQQQQRQQHQQGSLPSHQQQAQQNSPYAAHNHSSGHHTVLSSPSSLFMSHQQSVMSPQATIPPHHQRSHSSDQVQQILLNGKTPAGSVVRPQPVSRGTPNTSTGPAPGPIPATTPLVVYQDSAGVQWISFDYSRDRVKQEYRIRCDVESVNIDELSSEFKATNCVYPRACVPKNDYKGNRLHYETECNAVGWALAQLNGDLRGKRGLIQRAVDSWRNSNQDPRLRSRRVRRQTKMNNRKGTQHVPEGATGFMHASHGTAHAGLQPPEDMKPGVAPPVHPPQPHHYYGGLPRPISHNATDGCDEGHDTGNMFHSM